MKKIFFTMALVLPMSIMAEEATDTIVVYHGKQIVINEDSLETHVSILNPDGTIWHKSKESTFVNSQEVERFFISSPFFNASSQRYQPTTPQVYVGFAGMSSSALGFSGNADMPVKTFRSTETGIPWLDGGVWLNKRNTWSLSLSYDFLLNRYSFGSHHVLTKDANDQVSLRYDADGVGESRLMAIGERLKLMAKWYKYFNDPDDDRLCLGAGLTLDLPGIDNYSSFKSKGYTYAEAAGLKMNPVRLGINVQVSWSGIIFYIQKSLTPLFKSGYGPKVYPFSIGIGFAL